MLRLVSGSTLAAILGLAGLAFAQEGLIVDPWQPAQASVTAFPAAPPAPAVVRSSPAAPAPRIAAAPAVVPVGPPLDLGTDPWVTPASGPVARGVADPWQSAPPKPPAKPDKAARPAGGGWAHEIDEIVNPWAKAPLVAATDPLIVDPWRR